MPLARHIFGAPTYYYKTGIVFLAWLAGHQDGFSMVGGLQSARSLAHLAQVFALADAAGLLPDPELAAHRLRTPAGHGRASASMTRSADRQLGCRSTRRRPPRWSLPEAVAGCVERGARRDRPVARAVAEVGLDEAAELVARRGPAGHHAVPRRLLHRADPAEARPLRRQPAGHRRGRRARAPPTLVLVPGGLPAGARDLPAPAHRAADGDRARWSPYAAAAGVTLAHRAAAPDVRRRPRRGLHPGQALDLAERFDPDAVGVVVDTYHVWWDPRLADRSQRAGDRHRRYQVCDWVTPLPADVLLGRGMMGDGHIDFAAFTRAVAAAGYAGDIEVEIFNADVWAQPPAEVVATMAQRYLDLVAPYLDD